MIESLTDDVLNYLNFLEDIHHLNISIHDLSGYLHKYMPMLLPYNIHRNAYCVAVKSNYNAWKHCIERQSKVVDKAKSGAFFGVCYCGVAEYVFPLFSSSFEIIGFLSVTGYRIDSDKCKEKIFSFAKKHSLDQKNLTSIYKENLSDEIPEFEFIKSIIMPLTHMYTLLYDRLSNLYSNDSQESPNQLYTRIISYLNRFYANKITLDSLAAHFHCSKSHISHLFLKYNEVSFVQYLKTLRLNAAKLLLANTEMSIQEIAFTTGFSDANYFTLQLKQETGLAPSKWRKENKNKKL